MPASPLDTASEAEYKFKNSGAKMIIFLDLLYDKLSALLQAEPNIPAVAADVSDYLPFPKNMLFRLKKKSLGKPLPDFQRAATVTYASVLKLFHHAAEQPTAPLKGEDTESTAWRVSTTRMPSAFAPTRIGEM